MFDATVDNDGVVHLSGRFDASQVNKAKEVFKTVDKSCIIDFEKLDYISSAGIGVLLETYTRLNKSGHALKLINMNKNIRNIFYYAGLKRLFEFE